MFTLYLQYKFYIDKYCTYLPKVVNMYNISHILCVYNINLHYTVREEFLIQIYIYIYIYMWGMSYVLTNGGPWNSNKIIYIKI